MVTLDARTPGNIVFISLFSLLSSQMLTVRYTNLFMEKNITACSVLISHFDIKIELLILLYSYTIFLIGLVPLCLLQHRSHTRVQS